MSKKTDVRVTALEGRYITGYGSRAFGEVFKDLHEKMVRELLKHQSAAFERVIDDVEADEAVTDVETEE